MIMDDKIRLHDLRLRHGMGMPLDPHEYNEMLTLQAMENVELQESAEHGESEFAAIGVR
jgi:hypothetical protein